jgi:hypothetical protein
MNVRITPRSDPQRTLLWGNITRVLSDGMVLFLISEVHPSGGISGVNWPLKAVAEIALDDDPGGGF